MYKYRRAAAAIMLTSLISTACQDLPTAVRKDSTLQPRVASGASFSRGSGQKHRPSLYGCNLVDRAPAGSGSTYQKRALELGFRARAHAKDGRMLSYRYILGDPAAPSAVFACRIPRTTVAVKALERFLQVPPAKRHRGQLPSESKSQFDAPFSKAGVPTTAFGAPLIFKAEDRRTRLLRPGQPRFDFTATLDGITIYGEDDDYHFWIDGTWTSWDDTDAYFSGGGGTSSGYTADPVTVESYTGPWLGVMSCLITTVASGIQIERVAEASWDVVTSGKSYKAAYAAYDAYQMEIAQGNVNPNTLTLAGIQSRMYFSHEIYVQSISAMDDAFEDAELAIPTDFLACFAAFALPTP